MFKKSMESSGNVLAFEVSGKLTDADYESLTPVLEKAIATKAGSTCYWILKISMGGNPKPPGMITIPTGNSRIISVASP
jgi:hypothetical protein